jgi:HSP20 family molecular chaperone IbpA
MRFHPFPPFSTMHTIINPDSSASRRFARETSSNEAFRKPNYDCREHVDAVKLVVYVPGVDAAGVTITSRGPDLVVTARKTHFVRVNWQSLHLETSQLDYQLRLRLGLDFEYAAMQAEIRDGVLEVSVPKVQRELAREPETLRRVA